MLLLNEALPVGRAKEMHSRSGPQRRDITELLAKQNKIKKKRQLGNHGNRFNLEKGTKRTKVSEALP